jgi:hypothetical protein
MRDRCGKIKRDFLIAGELGNVNAMVCFGFVFDKDDPQRFFWLGRAAAYRVSFYFLDEMLDQVHNFISGSGHAKVVFAIGQALKGQVDNEKQTIFWSGYNFDTYIGPAKQALHFCEFQLQSYRKAVESWAIIALRNRVVKDIRKMIGKMIWNGREEAAYSDE